MTTDKRTSPAFHIVYLTGAPASGKSSLCHELRAAIEPLFIFEYGAELTKLVQKRVARGFQQEQLRARSSSVVTADDVKTLDAELLRIVDEKRLQSHVIIDTHAVTKESYGFRVTPFTYEQLSSLAPTIIACLYADSAMTRSRIDQDAQGRPPISSFEADLHTTMQAAVAINYSILSGAPAYFLDSGGPRKDLVGWFASALAKERKPTTR